MGPTQAGGRWAEPGASMMEAALEPDFYDQSHFIDEFRKMFGLPPGALIKSAGNLFWWIQATEATRAILQVDPDVSSSDIRAMQNRSRQNTLRLIYLA